MAYPTNKKGALLALAVSGGLWAWQNRDKITSWFEKQRGQLENNNRPFGGNSSTGNTYSTPPANNSYSGNSYDNTPASGSYTGSTRRMTEPGSHMGQGFPEGNEG
jgi:hypothetical protein